MLARLSVLNDVECTRAAEHAEVLRVNPAVEGHKEEARGRRLEDLGRLCQVLGNRDATLFWGSSLPILILDTGIRCKTGLRPVPVFLLVSQTPIADDIAAMALGKSVSMPGRIVPVPVDASQLQRLEGSYRFGPDFFRPHADVQLRIESGQPLLDWGNQFRTSLIPVGNGEFVDRQFWARTRMEQDGSGFVYSTSGCDFKVRKSG